MSKPVRRNPLLPAAPPTLPPRHRSRAALRLADAAAGGDFRLQVCDACAAVQYPPRDICGGCLSEHLVWREVARGGTVLAETTVRISADPYFRARTPWRVGAVRLDCGPSVVAHLHGDVGRGARVRMAEMLDRAGQGVMVALPDTEAPARQDDRLVREMTCDPSGRRVLVTDARTAIGQAVAHALVDAGATVLAGIADAWKPFAGRERLGGTGIEAIDLDVTDTASVQRAAGAYGGRVEILVNTALHIRPGGIFARAGLADAREAMDVAYFGALRLAQAFAPALRARGADGTRPACAWVNILSVAGLAPPPGLDAHAAAHAAARSLAQSLRTELRAGGIRVLDAYVGPLDDTWHEAVPPPKVSPRNLADAILGGLRGGLEEVAVGDVAQDVMARWRDDPAILARDGSRG